MEEDKKRISRIKDRIFAAHGNNEIEKQSSH